MRIRNRIISFMLSIMLFVGLFGAETLAAAAVKPEQWVAVQMGFNNVRGRREYTDSQQVERLLALLPRTSDRVAETVEVGNRTPAVLEVNQAGAVQRYFYYPQGYVARQGTDGSLREWYSTSLGHWRLLVTLTDWNPYAMESVIKYKDETVTDVYSFQYKYRSYHRVVGAERIGQVISMLEEKKPGEEATYGNVGFFVITDDGSHSIYLDAGSDQELVNLSVACIQESSPLIQWLVYMDPAKIESITATALLDSDNLSRDASPKRAALATTDADSIARIADYLQGMVVQEDPNISWEPLPEGTTGKRLTLDIKFASGTLYHITADDKTLTISCPEMSEHITYRCYAARVNSVADLLALMPGAKLAAV